MKLLSKSLLSCVVLSGMVGLTACQSTPMKTMPDNDAMKHTHDDGHDHTKVEALSDGHILKVLSVANDGEIMQANVAIPKLKTEQARKFAQTMISQHSANEQKGQVLGNRLLLAPLASHTSNDLQVDSNKIVTKLDKMDAPVDKTYIMSQIQVHDKVLKTIDTKLLPNAYNPELRNFLVETRYAVAMHLQEAKEIEKEID